MTQKSKIHRNSSKYDSSSKFDYKFDSRIEKSDKQVDKKLRRNTMDTTKTMQSLNYIMNSLDLYLDEFQPPRSNGRNSSEVYDNVLDVIDYFGTKTMDKNDKKIVKKSDKKWSLFGKKGNGKNTSDLTINGKSLSISSIESRNDVISLRSITSNKIESLANEQVGLKIPDGQQIEPIEMNNTEPIEMNNTEPIEMNNIESIDMNNNIEPIEMNNNTEQHNESFEIEQQISKIPQPLLTIVPDQLLKKLENNNMSTQDICGYISLHRKKTKEFNEKVMNDLGSEFESVLDVQVVKEFNTLDEQDFESKCNNSHDLYGKDLQFIVNNSDKRQRLQSNIHDRFNNEDVSNSSEMTFENLKMMRKSKDYRDVLLFGKSDVQELKRVGFGTKVKRFFQGCVGKQGLP